MRLVFAGTPEVAIPSLEALMASAHEVVAVVTRPDAPAGRGRKLTPSPVAVQAAAWGLPVLKPEHPRATDFLAQLRHLSPDVCPVVAYGVLLPQAALDIPTHGWINLHFSLLPRWRGAAPVQRAIMAGDPEIGTACFRIVKDLDAGDVYRMTSQLTPEATAGEVLSQLAASGAEQLLETLDAIARGEQPHPQALTGVTQAPKVTPHEARIDFTKTAFQVRNHILGCSPSPGAWCEYGSIRLKVFRARKCDDAPSLEPGQLRVTKRQVVVGTGDGAVEFLEVQAPGKRRMSAIDWARSAAGRGRLG